LEISSTGLSPLDAAGRVYAHTYSFSKTGRANMLVVALGEGRLLVVSPAARPSDALFAELERHGRVVALVAPNGFHHMGLSAFVRRFPEALTYAPEAAAVRIRKKSDFTGTIHPLSALAPHLPSHVALWVPPGLKAPDLFLTVTLAEGCLWHSTDLLINMPKLPGGFPGLLFKLMKSAPGYRYFKLASLIYVKDRKALKAHWLEALDRQPATLIVPGHGDTVQDPGGRLTRALVEAL
jgi:glyoxylase-like metal-dependent hydrolase (beta-lactamase superfamily II)